MTAPSIAPRPRAPYTRAQVIAAALRAAGRAVRRVLGVPDYQQYVTHMREHHAGTPVLGPREFERERLAARYERPGSRCC